MDWSFWLPVLTLSSSLVPGSLIFLLREQQTVARSTLNMAGATFKLVFVGLIFWGFFHDQTYEARIPFVPGVDLVLRVDPIALLFVSLSAVLWFLTTIYAIGYLEESPHRSRFFGFFSLSVTATMGLALAGNLMTFFLFYELLTLATYPLVIHRGTPETITAGRTYLVYTLGGGVLLLLGIVWSHQLAGAVEFQTGGVLAHVADAYPIELTAIFALLVAGMGVKSALVPFHGWLPEAMVAPAPVSALLHAVAVVKAGAYGIVRVVYDFYGLELAGELGLLTPLSAIASITIIYGSVRALQQQEVKRRLAWSTVSQLAYIALGTSVFGPLATIGGLVHLVHQGIMKITLFFCAGNVSETLGIHRVDQMNGVGRRMPLTMGAFTLAAFAMIGVPPMAGFVTKWHLGLGGLAGGQPWIVAILVASTLLNAAYFLPLVHAAWFKEPETPWNATHPRHSLETRWTLLLPALATALLSLGAGVLAATDYSPLALARLITRDMYP